MVRRKDNLRSDRFEKLLHPFLVKRSVRSSHCNLWQFFMKRRPKRLPLGKIFVEYPRLVPLIPMFEKIRFIPELHCDQLPSQCPGYTSAFSKRLFQSASAKIESIDASPPR